MNIYPTEIEIRKIIGDARFSGLGNLDATPSGQKRNMPAICNLHTFANRQINRAWDDMRRISGELVEDKDCQIARLCDDLQAAYDEIERLDRVAKWKAGVIADTIESNRKRHKEALHVAIIVTFVVTFTLFWMILK